jgi:predicted dehydrogenase
MLLPKPFTAWHGEALPILIESRPGQEPMRLDAPAADPYLEMVTAFGRAVQSKGQVCTSAEDAAGTLAVLEACQRSLSTGAYAKVASWRTSLPR